MHRIHYCQLCRDVSHARSLLAALFQNACKFNDEVQRTKAEITDLEDANEILKGRTTAAQEEFEERRAELDDMRASVVAAEANAAQSALLVAQSEAARKQVWGLLLIGVCYSMQPCIARQCCRLGVTDPNPPCPPSHTFD